MKKLRKNFKIILTIIFMMGIALGGTAQVNMYYNTLTNPPFCSGCDGNAIFSSGAGISSGQNNCLFGITAGSSISSGGGNTMFGYGTYVGGNGSNNSFLGNSAGTSNTGSSNVFIGAFSGQALSSASNLVFVGYDAGASNTSGTVNTFIGYQAGYSNSGGSNNTFLGSSCGSTNGSGSDNSFFGTNAGQTNSSGGYNCFFGELAGSLNTGASGSQGSYNCYIGYSSGSNNSGAGGGYENTYVGNYSGNSDNTGYENTMLGYGADVTATNLHNASAIGFGATVGTNNHMVFGNSAVTAWGFGMDPIATHMVGGTPNVPDIIDVAVGVSYAYMDGGGNWFGISDKNLKNNFRDVNPNEILEKVMSLPITKWNYKSMPDKDYIGPMAQDFYAAFQLSNDSTHICASAPGDIALVAIKALGKQSQNLKQQNAGLQSQVQGLTSQNQALQAQVATNTQTLSSQQALLSSQQSQIESLSQSLEQLRQLQEQCCNMQQQLLQQGNNITPADEPKLDQNAPNPFSQNTSIGYYLPNNVVAAVISVITVDGKELMHFNITGPGSGQILISGGSLSPGTYIYNMSVQGKQIDSKRMVLVGE